LGSGSGYSRGSSGFPPFDDLHRKDKTILRLKPRLLPSRAFEEGKMKPYHIDHFGDSL